MSRAWTLVALGAILAACGGRKEHEDVAGNTSTASAVKPADKSGANAACVTCRDTHCAYERAACEAESSCSHNLGCSDECMGDKACMGKCVHPHPKFASYGRCIVTQCKGECLSRGA